jgi:hypothetical protein
VDAAGLRGVHACLPEGPGKTRRSSGFLPRTAYDHQCVENERLGLLRAAVIVFVSGLIVAVLPMLFPMGSASWWSTGGSSEPGGIAWDTVAIALAVTLILEAIAVVVGVRMCGFRVGFVFTTFALGLSTALTVALAYVTTRGTADDSSGVAGPAFGVALLPIGLLIGVLLPAFLIDGAARPDTEVGSVDAAYPAPPPYPPYPPYTPPEPRR